MMEVRCLIFYALLCLIYYLPSKFDYFNKVVLMIQNCTRCKEDKKEVSADEPRINLKNPFVDVPLDRPTTSRLGRK